MRFSATTPPRYILWGEYKKFMFFSPSKAHIIEFFSSLVSLLLQFCSSWYKKNKHYAPHTQHRKKGQFLHTRDSFIYSYGEKFLSKELSYRHNGLKWLRDWIEKWFFWSARKVLRIKKKGMSKDWITALLYRTERLWQKWWQNSKWTSIHTM